jgi:hypothetical protein
VKTILCYITAHITSDFRLFFYLYFFSFITICIYLNYSLNFEKSLLNKHYGTFSGILYYILFYGFAYYAICIPKLVSEGKSHLLKSQEFWVKGLLFISLIGFSGAFYYTDIISRFFETNEDRYYILKIIHNSKRAFIYIIPLIVLKYVYDKNTIGLYGLIRKSFSVKPYIMMLIIMFPLITWASFQADFQHTYPTLKPWRIDTPLGMPNLIAFSIYELIYAIDFVFVELIFRGALIIGLAKIIGKDAILPMVSAYAFLHFGKPLGETLGSIFGGYILGVIALYSKNIWGGCIIHIGVALLMDFMALFQYHFMKN